MLKKIGNNELFSSILYIVVGVLLAIFRAETLRWVMIAIGVLFIVTGVLELVKKNWAGGAISLVIGIAIAVLAGFFVNVALIVLGVLVAIKGVIALIDVIKRSSKNALEIIFPILAILVGIGLAFGPLASIIILIVGILLIVDGVIGLVGALKK